ncbi:MAG: dihydroorotase [Paracoccaceae bacterium]
MGERLTIRRPSDWHVHLRDGAMLAAVAGPSLAGLHHALVMPNLVPPVATGAEAAAYRARILAALPEDATATPVMTLYLTEDTDGADVRRAHADGVIRAVKLYPAGATTNSASGVRAIERVMPVLEVMAEAGVPLCVHGEVTDPEIDIFDREAVFVERVLAPLRARLPELRIVLEHVTTREGLAFVRESGPLTAGTLTTHHLVIDRNHLLAGGIRPHYYCLPVAKRRTHREALVEAATGGEACFFSGTDSAPHAEDAKLAPCGCAGCFTAPVSLAVLAHVFEAAGALDRLEGFVSTRGAAFYGLPPPEDRVTLERGAPWQPPGRVETGAGAVVVFDPGFPLHWRAVETAAERRAS